MHAGFMLRRFLKFRVSVCVCVFVGGGVFVCVSTCFLLRTKIQFQLTTSDWVRGQRSRSITPRFLTGLPPIGRLQVLFPDAIFSAQLLILTSPKTEKMTDANSGLFPSWAASAH